MEAGTTLVGGRFSEAAFATAVPVGRGIAGSHAGKGTNSLRDKELRPVASVVAACQQSLPLAVKVYQRCKLYRVLAEASISLRHKACLGFQVGPGRKFYRGLRPRAPLRRAHVTICARRGRNHNLSGGSSHQFDRTGQVSRQAHAKWAAVSAVEVCRAPFPADRHGRWTVRIGAAREKNSLFFCVFACAGEERLHWAAPQGVAGSVRGLRGPNVARRRFGVCAFHHFGESCSHLW